MNIKKSQNLPQLKTNQIVIKFTCNLNNFQRFLICRQVNVVFLLYEENCVAWNVSIVATIYPQNNYLIQMNYRINRVLLRLNNNI